MASKAGRNEIVLHEKAADDLRFIRTAMERASSFTAVPGWGGAAMGSSAVVAAVIASRQEDPTAWVAVWLLELTLAVCIGGVTMWLKARRTGQALAGAVGRRFALGFTAPVLAGAVVSGALFVRGETSLLPCVWLVSYGAGVISGGTMSVLAVPLMGCGMMVLGIAAAVQPWRGDLWLGLGFGLLQIMAGVWIARRHGG